MPASVLTQDAYDPTTFAAVLVREDTVVCVDPQDELPGHAEPLDDASSGKGTVVEEMVTCGDETCECMEDEGEKHGPYLCHYYREDGEFKSEYERKIYFYTIDGIHIRYCNRQ